MTVRMLPINGSATGWAGPNDNRTNRRSYTATAGQFIDAFGDNVAGDATTLNSQGFIAIGDLSGPTTARPTYPPRPGFTFVDTTLALIVVWDGANWRNPVSGATA